MKFAHLPLAEEGQRERPHLRQFSRLIPECYDQMSAAGDEAEGAPGGSFAAQRRGTGAPTHPVREAAGGPP